MTPDEYCQEKAAASGSSFYYSFLFLADDQRRAITALYAFCREVDDIVDEVSEASVGRMKLAWWRSEIARVFSGEASHPVARALQPAVEHFDLPRAWFDEIIAGMEMDLDHNGFRDFDELAQYCYRAAAVVGLLSARIFGYDDDRTRDYAHDLGMALQLTNIVRDVREDAARGRIYIPTAELEHHGVRPGELSHPASPEHVRALLKTQADRARQYYDRALAALPDQDRYAQRSGIIMGRIYMTLLDEIERDGFRVLEHRVALTPIRKLWIAWRTARAEERRRKRWRRHVAA
jgi:phytoene synthase